MPTLNPGESQKAYISRCIPYMMKEKGVDSKQAAGKCYGLWRNAQKHKRTNKAALKVKRGRGKT